ncbi:MAG: Eco57I restriction-modification methylase domain-containing protein [Caldisphaera sp.]
MEKKFIFGQYFTKKEIIPKLLNLLLKYKKYTTAIRILEPAFGSGNFISILKSKGFKNIEGCEIDPELTTNPKDFFKYSLSEKFDLIIGNPPFTKYNLEESYYYPKKYYLEGVNPTLYLNGELLKKDKLQIENAFILKAIKHLRNENSTIAFVLPISFFIKGKNLEVKKEIIKRFSTIIIYQSETNLVEDPIQCCFAIFTKIDILNRKIVLIYEDSKNVYEIVDEEQLLTEELIPSSFLYKKNVKQIGTSLSKFLLNKSVKYKLSYKENNINGANIISRRKIPQDANPEDYYLAVVRVGNSSVGRAGLINPQRDILNAMFYVFQFVDQYNKNKRIKEAICEEVNANQEYFKKITSRVGSKSIKKEDILSLKIKLDLSEEDSIAINA